MLRQGCITNWGSFVLLQLGKCYYKLGQHIYYKMGQASLQIRAAITNFGKCYYKLGQTLLQIGAAITNWGNCYKLGHNKCIQGNCGLRSQDISDLDIAYLFAKVKNLYFVFRVFKNNRPFSQEQYHYDFIPMESQKIKIDFYLNLKNTVIKQRSNTNKKQTKADLKLSQQCCRISYTAKYLLRKH